MSRIRFVGSSDAVPMRSHRLHQIASDRISDLMRPSQQVKAQKHQMHQMVSTITSYVVSSWRFTAAASLFARWGRKCEPSYASVALREAGK